MGEREREFPNKKKSRKLAFHFLDVTTNPKESLPLAAFESLAAQMEVACQRLLGEFGNMAGEFMGESWKIPKLNGQWENHGGG